MVLNIKTVYTMTHYEKSQLTHSLELDSDDGHETESLNKAGMIPSATDDTEAEKDLNYVFFF